MVIVMGRRKGEGGGENNLVTDQSKQKSNIQIPEIKKRLIHTRSYMYYT